MEYMLTVLCVMVLIMNVIRIIFSEFDGRRANKQYNIRYFLLFTKSFVYTRYRTILFLAIVVFFLTTNQTVFTVGWLLDLGILVSVSVIVDIISQYAGYVYSKKRFAPGIAKAIDIYEKIIKDKNEEKYEDIIYSNNHIIFNEIVSKYVKKGDHISITSMDGGRFANTIENLPDITYVIDTRKPEAETLLKDKSLKITNLASGNLLPFKDERIDAHVCSYTNFNKEDVHRILKNEGLLLVHQSGGQHLKEINNFYIAVTHLIKWNKSACQLVLENQGFSTIDSQEIFTTVKFQSMAGLFTYLKSVMPEKIINFEDYINQYAFIAENIRVKGFFTLTEHEFYLVCKKSK